MDAASNRADPIHVDVSAKASLTGEVPSEALGRSLHALVDAVSPITEGLGLIGDHIRVHRCDVALKIVRRARQLSKAAGRPVVPPPLKFTVPFLEHASTEIDDDEICELWANLLVDACDEFTGIHLTYVQLLSEISGFEARYLDSIGKRYTINDSIQPSKRVAEHYSSELTHLLSNSAAKELDLPQGDQEINSESAADVAAWIFRQEPSGFCRPATVSIPIKNTDDNLELRYTTLADHATTAYLLQRQGLIQVETAVANSPFGTVNAELACLTPLGADFVVACMGRG